MAWRASYGSDVVATEVRRMRVVALRGVRYNREASMTGTELRRMILPAAFATDAEIGFVSGVRR